MTRHDVWPTYADENFIIEQSLIIADSYKHWTGRHLVPPGLLDEETAQAIYKAPFIVASTNADPDPLLNYGNREALNLWELSWEEFTKTPGRCTAEPIERDERERFLSQVKQNGFIDNYQGVRITSTGRRFKIHQAVVWNLRDNEGDFCGQAVMFKRWDFL